MRFFTWGPSMALGGSQLPLDHVPEEEHISGETQLPTEPTIPACHGVSRRPHSTAHREGLAPPPLRSPRLAAPLAGGETDLE